MLDHRHEHRRRPVVNPLVPTPADGALMVVSLVALALSLSAFLSLARAGAVTGRRGLAWALVVLFVPFLGAAAWFVARHREQAAVRRHRSLR